MSEPKPYPEEWCDDSRIVPAWKKLALIIERYVQNQNTINNIKRRNGITERKD